jgi:hypothetical protein
VQEYARVQLYEDRPCELPPTCCCSRSCLEILTCWPSCAAVSWSGVEECTDRLSTPATSALSDDWTPRTPAPTAGRSAGWDNGAHPVRTGSVLGFDTDDVDAVQGLIQAELAAEDGGQDETPRSARLNV